MQKSNARLTVKEEEVLSCLVNNRTRKQIAAILDISENTIKTHIKNISIKLGCRSQTEIPQIAKNFYKLQSINRIYQKLNAMHNVHMFMAKNSSKLPFNGIIVKTLFVDRYQCLKSVFSKYEIQFDVIESKAVPLLKSVYDILHISRDQIIIVNNDHRKPLNFVVYNYDKARFIQAFFQKVFGDHIARFIAPIAPTTDSKYKIKKITIFGSLLCLLSCIAYRFYYSTRSIDHISPMVAEMDIEKSREVFNRMNEVYKRQQTNLKLLILRGPTSAGKTFCARKFSTNKIHDLKTEIDASSEANLYNSLHSLAKLLVTDNQYLIQQLADIHSIASNDIKKIEMINFVFSALQNYNSWFIIVDDVNDYKNIRIITAIARNFKSNGTLLFTINSRHKIDNNEFIVDVNGEENTLSQDHKALSVDHILNEISSAIFRNEFVNARQLVAELNHKILNKVQKIRLLISEAVLQMKLGHRSICNELLEYAFKLVTSENNTDDQMAILKSNIVKYRALNAYLNRINTSEMYTCINELNSALDVLNNCRPSQKVYVEIVDLLLTRSGMLVSTMQYSEAQQDLERAGFYMQQLTTKGSMYLFHKAKIAIDKGHIFLRTGYLEKAASCYANAKAIFTEIKSYDYMFRLLEQESEIFIRLGKLNAAEENCKIVIADHNVFDNPYNSIFVCTTYYNMAVIQYRKRNFEQSRYYFFRFFINVEQYISKMLPEKMEWFSKHKAKFYDTADLTNCFKNSLDIFKQICLPDSEFISDFVRQNYINSIENVVTD